MQETRRIIAQASTARVQPGPLQFHILILCEEVKMRGHMCLYINCTQIHPRTLHNRASALHGVVSSFFKPACVGGITLHSVLRDAVLPQPRVGGSRRLPCPAGRGPRSRWGVQLPGCHVGPRFQTPAPSPGPPTSDQLATDARAPKPPSRGRINQVMNQDTSQS